MNGNRHAAPVGLRQMAVICGLSRIYRNREQAGTAGNMHRRYRGGNGATHLKGGPVFPASHVPTHGGKKRYFPATGKRGDVEPRLFSLHESLSGGSADEA